MSNQNINPEKVTKPIQLLAAWLSGLVVVNAAFLVSATSIGIEHWSSSALVIASIINVPMFLVAIFLLQTKFRPEMQEDSYYSKYLEAQISPETGQLETEVEKSKFKDSIHLKQQLEDLNKKVNQLSSHIESTPEVVEISQLATNVMESIEGEFIPNIQLNDLLPNYSEIIDRLKAENITISSEFGSSNPEKIEPPKLFMISFGSNVNIPVLQKIIEICKPLGAAVLSYVDDEYSTDNIYIGSYGYEIIDRKQYVLDESSYSQLLDKNMTLSKLKYLVG
ncbi:hypothetical protein [Aliivibrio fischeri]|uniref:Uncharacterized protein n=1 Tax=Aliivibrio fischeri SR5 TaxID=1088719 RepID=A0AAV3EMK5_ALIFS|nr:hypothetical protein [Aliivibrio fischeri]EHN67973.1 hypothetical protein VFSR5_2698 [Aliivibrio fischeri SR5]MUJ22519.1 hypothetical protein [Aliivibrio fischeri]